VYVFGECVMYVLVCAYVRVCVRMQCGVCVCVWCVCVWYVYTIGLVLIVRANCEFV